MPGDAGRMDEAAKRRFLAAIKSGVPLRDACRRFRISADTAKPIMKAAGLLKEKANG